jgi:ketosteroid isomerase-like protein
MSKANGNGKIVSKQIIVSSISTSNESKIKDLMEKRLQAIRVNDIETAVLSYADDVLLFDVVGELFETGSIAVKKD